MRVTAVDSFPLRVPLPVAIRDARSTIEFRAAVLVRVRTDDPKIVGWGEAACFGGVERLVAGVVDHLSALVVGRPLSPREVTQELFRRSAHYSGGLTLSAISGIEIALWDAFGQDAGLPVCGFWDIEPLPVRTYRTSGFYQSDDPNESLDDLRRDVEGYDPAQVAGVKIKIGRFGVVDDVRRALVARELLGPNAVLIVDANNAYEPARAAVLCSELAALDVRFVEEPIEFGDPVASAELRRASPVAIAGYELEPSYKGCRTYIEAGAVDYIQPDATWSGGIGECVAVGELAAQFGIAMVPHNFSTPVGTAANYHAACVAGSPLLELDGTGSPLVDNSVSEGQWRHESGTIRMCEGAGLGISDPSIWLPGLRHG